jgi:arylsulfatase A-like enzyme
MFDDLRPELSIYGRKHMITPNFERLASKSVVFDNAYTHIAVCNPARDALLTGLRPDTIGTYAFQSSFRPFLTLPQQLNRMGYNTAGFGKILHWESNDRDMWNYDSWENDWYGYQNFERSIMNSSTMPDKIKPIEKFRDHEFATRTIETLRKIVHEPKPWMVAIGFKHPHLAIHVPHHFYKMYKGKEEMWRLSKKELRFPPSSPEVAYRCCAEPSFFMMEEEGAKKSNKEVHLGDINFAFTDKMHDEMMLGYCAGVSFVDAQLGRLLDAIWFKSP